MANPFVHIELNSTDARKAKSFYGKLFDWKMSDMPMPGGVYTMINVGKEGAGGGITKTRRAKEKSAWIPYAVVKDVKVSTKKAKKLGGKILHDVTEVPDMGWYSIVQDPTGAVVGLWETK